MKVSKNNFDIFLDDILYCPKCSFQIKQECKWLHVVKRFTPRCGGIKSKNLFDIFKL